MIEPLHPLVQRGREALARRDFAVAAQAARAALRTNPLDARAHALFGLVLCELNDLSSGEWHLRRALELAPAQAECLTTLAINLMRQGRTAEAETYFEAAAALAPRDLQTLAHWSKLQEVQGNLQRAEELLERAAAASSADEVDLLRVNYLARQGRHSQALAVLEAIPTLNGDGQVERGRLRDRLGQHAGAWDDWVEGKAKLAKQSGIGYQTRAVEAFFARLKRFFVHSNMQFLPRTTPRSDVAQPIFVMGFPRSGTTLIEQVLASHSAVRPAGELTFIGEFRGLINLLFPDAEPFPQNLAQTFTADNRHAASLLRDYYFARAEGQGLLQTGKAHFTDKMPFNEIWLPLVRMAFPRAKIVNVVRHPLDVCVSMLSNHLTHGFNCAFRIEDIVHQLASVFDLVQSYRREFDVADCEMKYEAFVRSPVEQTRRLLQYLELPFEETCLTFHENRRYAPTPSYAQVAEKPNDRSIGRHRHYRRHLQPFVSRLEPIMAAYGYDGLQSPS